MSNEIAWLEPQSPDEIMHGAFEKYDLDNLYVLCSGGKDSMSVLHYIATTYPDKFAGAVFTNTGLGTQVTRKFVIDYCKEKKWKLWLTWGNQEHDRFYNVVMKYGFAGTGNHNMWMGFLKYHSWFYFMKWRLSLGEKAAFISGVRKKESWARNKLRLYTKTPVDVDGKKIFIKPFLYKNGIQLYKYFDKYDLKKSPAYSWADKSGECWCGAFSHSWELKMLERYDPQTFETIKWLEREIEKHGTKRAKKYNKWGMGPASFDIESQTTMDDFEGKVNEDYCGESCEV